MGLPDRQLLAMTAVVTGAAAAVSFLAGGGDWLSTLVALPFFATFAFWSILISRWVARRVAPPPRPAEPPPPTAPSSQRPDHARRRRGRRRRGRH